MFREPQHDIASLNLMTMPIGRQFQSNLVPLLLWSCSSLLLVFFWFPFGLLLLEQNKTNTRPIQDQSKTKRNRGFPLFFYAFEYVKSKY